MWKCTSRYNIQEDKSPTLCLGFALSCEDGIVIDIAPFRVPEDVRQSFVNIKVFIYGGTQGESHRGIKRPLDKRKTKYG